MRIILSILLVILLASGQNALAQIELGLGYQSGYTKLGGMNFTIDRYNETRPWLARPMNRIHVLHGPNLYCRIWFSRVFVEGSLSFTHLRRRARGRSDVNFPIGERKIRLRDNNLKLGAGVSMFEVGEGELSAGMSWDIGTVKFHSKVAADAKDIAKARWVRDINHLTMGTTFFLRWTRPIADNISLMVSPFLQAKWSKTNFGKANEAINPETFDEDPTKLLSNVAPVGLNVAVIMSL